MATGADAFPAPPPPAVSVRLLLRDSAIYGLSNALVKLTGIVTVPIMTRTLSQAEYGATDVLAVLVALLVAFSTLGQDSAVARFFYDVEGEADRQQVVMQGLTTQLLACVVVVGAALMLARPILASRAPEHSGAYLIAVAAVPFTLLFQFWRGLLKWMLARREYVILSVGASLLTLGFIAALATAGLLTVRSFFTAYLLTNAIAAALGLWFCRRYLAWPHRLTLVRPMLRFGAPYAAVLLVSTLIPAVDRAIISTRVGLAPLGEYAVAVKYASLMLFPVMAFQTAWGPFCYATYRSADAANAYSRVLALFAGGAALACFALVALAEPFIRIFASEQYVSAAPLVVPMVFGLAAEACSWIVGLGIDLSKRSELSLVSYLVGLATAAAASWSLVSSFGIAGVAVGMSAGRVVQSVAYSAFGLRVYPMRLSWRRPVATLIAALLLAVAVQYATPPGALLNVAVRLIAFTLLLMLVVAQLSSPERTQVRMFLARLWPR